MGNFFFRDRTGEPRAPGCLGRFQESALFVFGGYFFTRAIFGASRTVPHWSSVRSRFTPARPGVWTAVHRAAVHHFTRSDCTPSPLQKNPRLPRRITFSNDRCQPTPPAILPDAEETPRKQTAQVRRMMTCPFADDDVTSRGTPKISSASSNYGAAAKNRRQRSATRSGRSPITAPDFAAHSHTQTTLNSRK